MLHWWTYLRTMGANFHEVVPGRLYRGATPEPKNLRKWHKKHGIKTWIDLRLPSDCGVGSRVPSDRTRLFVAQDKVCEELGIEHIRIPISDREPTDEYDVTRCLRFMNDSANQPVFVACQGGRHRTGEMVALYGQRFLGWNEDQVKDSLKQGGFYKNGHERFARALETLLGFTLLLLCLVVPASGQTPEDWRPLNTDGPVPHVEGAVVIGRAPIFTSDETTIVYDVGVQIRGNPIRGALAGVRTLRPHKIRGDQHDPGIPWWQNPYLRIVPASRVIPLNAPSARETATPIAVSRHSWLKPVSRPVAHTQAKIAPGTSVRVATAGPKSLYGVDSPRFDRSYWVPFGLAVASSCTDWHSTSGALDRGGREANPVFRTNRGLAVRYGANVAATAAFLGYTAWVEHKGHRRVARILLWTLAGLRVTASVWNYNLHR